MINAALIDNVRRGGWGVFHVTDDDKLRAERRAFLEQCGRFAAVTPPAVTLMLAVGDKAAVAASGVTITTVTATTTTTP